MLTSVFKGVISLGLKSTSFVTSAPHLAYHSTLPNAIPKGFQSNNGSDPNRTAGTSLYSYNRKRNGDIIQAYLPSSPSYTTGAGGGTFKDIYYQAQGIIPNSGPTAMSQFPVPSVNVNYTAPPALNNINVASGIGAGYFFDKAVFLLDNAQPCWLYQISASNIIRAHKPDGTAGRIWQSPYGYTQTNRMNCCIVSSGGLNTIILIPSVTTDNGEPIRFGRIWSNWANTANYSTFSDVLQFDRSIYNTYLEAVATRRAVYNGNTVSPYGFLMNVDMNGNGVTGKRWEAILLSPDLQYWWVIDLYAEDANAALALAPATRGRLTAIALDDAGYVRYGLGTSGAPATLYRTEFKSTQRLQSSILDVSNPPPVALPCFTPCTPMFLRDDKCQ